MYEYRSPLKEFLFSLFDQSSIFVSHLDKVSSSSYIFSPLLKMKGNKVKN